MSYSILGFRHSFKLDIPLPPDEIIQYFNHLDNSILVIRRPLFFRDKYAIATDDNLVLMKGPCRKARVKWRSSKTQIFVHPNREATGSTLYIKSTLTQKTLRYLIGLQCLVTAVLFFSMLFGKPFSSIYLICLLHPYFMMVSFFHYEMMTLPKVLSDQLIV